MTVPWMSSGSQLIPAHVARPSMIPLCRRTSTESRAYAFCGKETSTLRAIT